MAYGQGGLDHRVAQPANDDEVGRLARTLNSMLDRMEASTHRERRFVWTPPTACARPSPTSGPSSRVALHHPETADWWQVAGDSNT